MMKSTMQKNSWHLGAALSLVAMLVGLSAPAVHASVSASQPEAVVSTAIAASPVHAAALPGGTAMPSFVFDFGADFDLIGFDVLIEFDPTKLSFNAAASTLTSGGNTMTVPNTLMAMQLASPDFLYSTEINPGAFTFNGTYLANSVLIPAGSSVTLTGVFDLLPGFVSGSTPVRVVGFAANTAFEEAPFDVTANVTAVPEPETWLMLLGGLGLVAARVRRRAAAK